MHHVHLEIPLRTHCARRSQLFPQNRASRFDFVFVHTTTVSTIREEKGGEGGSIPFLFQLVAEFKHLDFHLALAVVLEQALVRRARAVGLVQVVGAARVGGGRVARALEGEVALDVA